MSTEIVKIDPLSPDYAIIEKAAGYIRQGKIVAIPTETVYGLAVDCHNQEAVKRLSAVKNRPLDKPFSIAIASESSLERLARNVPLLAYKLIKKFWPGPLTLVLEASAKRSPELSEGRSRTIGLRMPNSRVSLRIIEEAGGEVVLPSANLSGARPPQDGKDVLEALDGKIDLIVDAGKTELGLESTVVDVTENRLNILREGAIKKESLESAARLKKILFICTGNSCRSVMAEGLLAQALKKKNRSDVEVLSAGIAAFSCLGPTLETLELLSQEGIDMSAHRSKKADKLMLLSSDLILVMEDYHEQYILELTPGLRNRLYLLKEFAKISDSGLNIGDPIGQTENFYEKTFYTIKEAVAKIVDLI